VPDVGRDLQAGKGDGVGEQAALEGLGGGAHALVRAGVVDAHRGAECEFGGDGEVVSSNGRDPGPGKPQEAQTAPRAVSGTAM